MPTTNVITLALRDADRRYGRFDAHRDRAALRRTITELHAIGHSNAYIADRVGLQIQQVRRITGGDTTEQRPAEIPKRDMTDQRCAHLENTANVALDMACRLRDGDPQIIWDALQKLDRGALQELAVIALAAIPTDRPKREVFAWVYQIGETL